MLTLDETLDFPSLKEYLFETQNGDFLRIMRLKRNHLILIEKVCRFDGNDLTMFTGEQGGGSRPKSRKIQLYS